jgi:hypothetical protein
MTAKTKPNRSLYERDFYAWANEQAELIRSGRFDEADAENIAEEIESMGRSEKRELINRLALLLMHLLKWQAQPMRRAKSWELTIREQRIRLASHLRDNPSLKSLLTEATIEAYELALVEAQRETGLGDEAFPESSPWTFEQAIQDGWLPGGESR